MHYRMITMVRYEALNGASYTSLILVTLLGNHVGIKSMTKGRT